MSGYNRPVAATGVARGAGCAALGLVLTALAGCGGDPEPAADAAPDTDDADPGTELAMCESVSGSRIRTLYHETPAGQRHALGFFDSELEVECSVATYADGVPRCYPSEHGGQLYFVDSTCTQAVVGFPGEALPYNRRIVGADDGCGDVAEYRQIGLPVVIDEGATVYRLSGNACNTATAPVLSFYQAGAVLAPEAFFPLTRSELPGDTRLTTRLYSGEDGSVLCPPEAELFDRELATPCATGTAEGGSLRCLPPGTGTATFFSDSACTTLVTLAVGTTTCEAPPPGFVRTTVGDGCERGERVTDVGAMSEVSRYQMSVEECVPSVTPVDVAYFDLVGDLPPDTFVAVGEEVLAGTERLQRVVATTDDGFAMPTSQWQDTRLGARCSFEMATDGVIRCLPLGRGISTVFSDDACTEPVRAVLGDPCAAEPPTHAREGIGGGRIRIFELAPEPATVYEVDGDCVAVDPAVAPAYLLGPELAPTSFVEGVRTVDP